MAAVATGRSANESRRDVRHLFTRAAQALRAAKNAYREGGVVAVERLASDAAYWRFSPRVRRWARELPRQEAADRAFDAYYGTETAGEELLQNLGIAAGDVARGNGRYRPVWADVFHQALAALGLDCERFTFVDYGSGKGKALLLASDYPFEEIIGIEYSPELQRIAERNIERYRGREQRCYQLRSICADALRFEPPNKPLVCFFFNPFDDDTMRAVLERLGESARSSRREIYLVYTNMRNVREHEDVLIEHEDLVLLSREERYLVFALQPCSG